MPRVVAFLTVLLLRILFRAAFWALWEGLRQGAAGCTEGLEALVAGAAQLEQQLIRDTILGLKASGVAIILVEQRIDAVLAVADRVTFIVNGVAVETLDAAGLDSDAEAFRRHVGV